MMSIFYEIPSAHQLALLVLSQFVVIVLAGSFVFLFKRKSRLFKQVMMGVLLFANMSLYVTMQLDSRINGTGQGPYLRVSCAGLLSFVLLSFGINLFMLFREIRSSKSISHRSIKEAFDNLPSGVCFFNEAGLPILCNQAIQRFSFAVCGKDVQFVTDLESCLSEDFVPVSGTVKEGSVFILSDDTAWRLEKKSIVQDNGTVYMQYIASDVTDLQRNSRELVRENAQLRKAQEELKKLSANVVTVTREEEILNTKMRVHDEMGKCLMAAQMYLKNEQNESIPDSVVTSWQRAVSMLKYNNDTQEDDMLSQIRKTCETVNLKLIQKGTLPAEERVAYILTCALRECVTNAVRYAEADELYAEFVETNKEAAVIISNSGRPPKEEIVEKGGLSNLRLRVERAGGTMTIRSFPEFQLTVTVPKRQEGVF